MSTCHEADVNSALPESCAYGLARVIGPQDEAVFLTSGNFADRLGRRQNCAFYAVIHRRFGTWTHVYRVVPADRLHGFVVYLERAFAGEAIAIARDWLRLAVATDARARSF
ncbi:MAG TPA: hypothetical protein VM639_19050 [Dongiaceae bacterium]|nr:hypothetical protein [Dongiaceae bacterium]